MDPFTMTELLLGKYEMTSDQLAQLRALNTKYFTELAALERRTRGGGPESEIERTAAREPGIDPRALLALHATIAADIREILTDEQRAVYDRNFPRVWEREIEGKGP